MLKNLLRLGRRRGPERSRNGTCHRAVFARFANRLGALIATQAGSREHSR